jgi:hypothetical protein
LRFNFVVAAHLVSALPSSVFARLASGAFYEIISLVTFYEILKIPNYKSQISNKLQTFKPPKAQQKGLS